MIAGNLLTGPSSLGTLPRMSDVFISSTLEIRATRAHVAGLAGQVMQCRNWLWSAAQIKGEATSRDLPDGTHQVIVADGDKLRDRILERSDERVVIDSEYRPRRTEVRGRHLRYELDLEAGPGTTKATLGLAFEDREAPTSTVEIRRYRRQVEQCLGRLAGLAAPDEG
jgi:hypothetical protein